MVERQLPKLNVAGSIPVSRSNQFKDRGRRLAVFLFLHKILHINYRPPFDRAVLLPVVGRSWGWGIWL